VHKISTEGVYICMEGMYNISMEGIYICTEEVYICTESVYISAKRHTFIQKRSVIKETTSSTQNECDFLRNKRVPNGPPYIYMPVTPTHCQKCLL
jgi:hypothetical protein